MRGKKGNHRERPKRKIGDGGESRSDLKCNFHAQRDRRLLLSFVFFLLLLMMMMIVRFVVLVVEAEKATTPPFNSSLLICSIDLLFFQTPKNIRRKRTTNRWGSCFYLSKNDRYTALLYSYSSTSSIYNTRIYTSLFVKVVHSTFIHYSMRLYSRLVIYIVKRNHFSHSPASIYNKMLKIASPLYRTMMYCAYCVCSGTTVGILSRTIHLKI